MRSAFISLVALVAVVSAAPAPTELGGKLLHRRDVHCGTTSDATLSDCQFLTSDQPTWDAAYNLDNTCHFTNFLADLYDATAYNVACYGNCCVYVYGASAFSDPGGGYSYDSQLLKNEAAGLLGCGDTAANKVNGMQKFSDGHAVCLSNGDGCGDCFDDDDFADGRRR